MNLEQIDLIELPATCPCCGSEFDDYEHKLRGPYKGSPYLYICNQCWKKSFFFFPDKTRVSDGFRDPLETLIGNGNQNLSGKVVREVPKTATQAMSKTMRIHLTDRLTVDAEVRFIPLNELSLDPTNARLRHLNGIVKDRDIEAFLLEQPEVKELYREILWAKGIREPLVVDSKGVVREGNERLVCLRRLSEEAHNGEISDVSENQFDRPQCLVLPKDIAERDIAIYVAGIHVKGKAKWRAINQAAYLYDLSTKYGMSHEEIRKAVGIAKKTIQTTFSSYGATKAYAEKHPDDKKWPQKYSYYYELFKNEKLRGWAAKNDNLQLFGELIYREKIPKGAYVRNFKTLIDDQEKFQKFLTVSKTEAKSILDSVDPSQVGSLKAIVKAIDTLQKFPRAELRTIAADTDKWRVIETLQKELESFIQDARSMKTTP